MILFPGNAHFAETIGLTGAAGTTITSNGSANTKGSWTQLGSDVSQQCCLMMFGITQQGSNQAVSFLIDIGVDQSGGTSFEVVVPNILIVYADSTQAWFLEHAYAFPIFLKAGAAVAARCQDSVGGGDVPVFANLYAGDLPTATYFEAIGVDEANTTGVEIDPGTGSGATLKTAWSLLESATSKHLTHVMPLQNPTEGQTVTGSDFQPCDLAIETDDPSASTSHIIVGDAPTFIPGNECSWLCHEFYPTPIPAGSTINARMAGINTTNNRNEAVISAIGMHLPEAA